MARTLWCRKGAVVQFKVKAHLGQVPLMFRYHGEVEGQGELTLVIALLPGERQQPIGVILGAISNHCGECLVGEVKIFFLWMRNVIKHCGGRASRYYFCLLKVNFAGFLWNNLVSLYGK